MSAVSQGRIPTKKQHYIPKMYLAGFTVNRNINGLTWVIDHQDIRRFQTAPRAIAFENDLYTVQIDGFEPDYVERDVFSPIEGATASIIRQIAETQVLPTGNELETLMKFIALMFVRTPAYRNQMNSFNNETYKKYLKHAISNARQFGTTVEDIKVHVAALPENANFRDVEEYVDSSDFILDSSQNMQVYHLLDAWDTFAPNFLNRNWSLYICSKERDHFVTNDNPARLDWINPSTAPGRLLGPGLRVKGTVISFPLTSKIAMLGTLENSPKQVEADTAMVARINARTFKSTKRFSFSPYRTFSWLNINDQVCSDMDLIAELRKARASV